MLCKVDWYLWRPIYCHYSFPPASRSSLLYELESFHFFWPRGFSYSGSRFIASVLPCFHFLFQVNFRKGWTSFIYLPRSRLLLWYEYQIHIFNSCNNKAKSFRKPYSRSGTRHFVCKPTIFFLQKHFCKTFCCYCKSAISFYPSITFMCWITTLYWTHKDNRTKVFSS